MSKEVNPFVVVLEGNEPIKKQLYGSDTEYYNSMCFHLPKALVNRSFDEEEGKRLVAFLKSLHYDFQCCDTVRGIYVQRNDGNVDQMWLNKISEDGYVWKQIENIRSRISSCTKQRTWRDLLRILAPKRKKRG